MANPVSFSNLDRDIEQALITLKKGSQLIKYSRKGKPKLRPFRISTICKDQVEVEVLKALTSGRQQHSRLTKSEIPDISFGGDFLQNGYPVGAALHFTPTISRARASLDLSCPINLVSSDVGSERINMQPRGGGGDGFRSSVSSTPSYSSGVSGQDDIESLGDVYLWGEVWSEEVLPDGSVSPFPIKIDVLAPKPLESNVVLDVQQIACGVGHIALVTRQGEVFTWGDESGGRLGHGVDRDFSRPHLVEALAVCNVEFLACGEFHACAVASSGDVFTWGDGTHNVGALGHGTDVSHWVPKRVCGPLEGLQVLSVACGTWHSALATSNGKLFTFGDGTYGVLGHGDRASVIFPREIQSLNGLKALKVSCGVWHTSAIVETGGSASRKLFTWGDGEKHRLGHGSKDTYLLPNCVSSLFDYNFHQVACGHTMTVALTTSGHVFTMGGTAYGQLGNPNSNGKLPVLVQDKLVGEFVEEISCGAFHVAVLTSRSEVYTWGQGGNGRLGHGDTEDRKTPTLVEALKDRLVKSISCGSNFTASICIHKWVSGADQSVCSGCRQAFGFTRKRHNCYNCGMVHCHACSSKKAPKAALAPTPSKPHRVCDACYTKLKTAEAGTVNRKLTATRCSIDIREHKGEAKPSKLLLSPVPVSDPLKYMIERSGVKSDSSAIRASQVQPLSQLKDMTFPGSLSAFQNAMTKPPIPNAPPPAPPPANARSPSPYSRRPTSPRSSPAFSKAVIDSLKKTNDHLNQEVSKLQNQVTTLKQRCDAQDSEIQNLLKETVILSTQGASRCDTATEICKSIAVQLNELAEKLPPEVLHNDGFRAMQIKARAFLDTNGKSASSSLPIELEPERRMGGQTDASEHGGSGSSISSAKSTRSHETSNPMNEVEKEVSVHFEHGVWIVCHQLRNGTKIFKRVKFSKRRFTGEQANEWWEANKEKVLKKFVPER